MKTFIIMLIFTMSFIGFHINGFNYNYKSNMVGKEPEKNERLDNLDNDNLDNYNLDNDNSNDNYSGTQSKIFNEMLVLFEFQIKLFGLDNKRIRKKL